MPAAPVMYYYFIRFIRKTILKHRKDTLSRWSQLHSLAATNPHWARAVGPFSLCVIYKEGLCPSSGGINRLMINYYY
jgi:hypothetical protein